MLDTPLLFRPSLFQGVGTSLRAAMMLDQQLNAAFQTGLRHSLDDSDHDATFDLSENEA